MLFRSHYKASYLLLMEKGYMDRIIEHLPAAEEIERVVDMLRKYAQERTQGYR